MQIGTRALSSRMQDGSPGLHLAFEVRRSVDRSQDVIGCTAWGLNAVSLSALQATDATCSLAAGYQLAPVVLGAGRIIPASLDIRPEGRQWVAKWKISEYGVALRAVDVGRHWDGAVTTDQLVAYLLPLTGLTRGSISYGRSVTYPDGHTVLGNAMDALQEVLDDSGSRYAVDAGALHVWPVGETRKVLRVVVSNATGLLGPPERVDKGRWRVRTTLEPTVRVGDQIRVSHATMSGVLRAVDVGHSGDSGYEVPYYTTITGAPIQ